MGGTFDPLHNGHLEIARRAMAAISADQVWFIPNAQPPHKQIPAMATAGNRLSMVRAAISNQPRFAVQDLEIRRTGPSYTVETLEELRRRHPSCDFFFVIGSDNFKSIGLWHRFSDLIRLCSFLVFERPGSPLACPPPDLPPEAAASMRYQVVKAPLFEAASSEIRQRLAQGESVDHLLPPGVRQYIESHHLYHPTP